MTFSVHSRLGRWVGSGALLGVTALTAFAFVHRSPTLRQELLATSGAYRPTPGLLTGEEVYRPWRPDREGLRAPEHAVSSRWRDGLDRLDAALYSALGGRTSGAIANLELAAREPATAVSALTDVSALYLLRFEVEQDPLDLLRAVQAAERGLAREPALPSLRFNRALALSELGTRALAIEAWQDILAQESSPAGGRRRPLVSGNSGPHPTTSAGPAPSLLSTPRRRPTKWPPSPGACPRTRGPTPRRSSSPAGPQPFRKAMLSRLATSCSGRR